MAEAAVSFVVQKLGDLIVQEAKELYGVRGRVEWLQRELRSMQCFLKDADGKSAAMGNESVKNWVRDIRDVAYEAEDIIDTFMLKVSRRRRRKRGFFSSIKRCVFIFNEPIAKHEVATEIQGIKDKLAEISNRRQQYGIVNIDEIGGTINQSRVQDGIPSLPELHDDRDFVGFDDEKKVIVNQLVDESIKDRLVISIVGMGGLGKTTLAKSIYNSSEIKRSFDIHAWVTISQEYKPIEIVRKILSTIISISKDRLEEGIKDRLEEGIETLSIDLYETLKKRKYLIVLDDVWSTDVWDQLKKVFPDDITNGSRVIITTRFLKVAKYADPTTPHELRFLNEHESWELFLSKAFPRQNIATCCPKDLEDVAHQLVDKCDGLPLALVVLGGLMSTKRKDFNSWNTVATGMTSWQHVEGGGKCLEILALSYNDLPYYLKSCFLYFGLFPEDYDISVIVLCRLWTAEGFFPVRDGKTIEETAKAHIEELVQRCMVQVTKRRYDESLHHCRVHDLLRDMCISKAKEDRFFEIYNNNAINGTTSTSCDARRLVVYAQKKELETLSYFNVKLRSIFNFGSCGFQLLSATVHGCKFLRVMHLYEVPFKELPSGIKFLIHLRYLGFGGDYDAEIIIPSWIGNLYNLQTIDVRGLNSKVIPDSLWGIESLRHVRFSSKRAPKMRQVPMNLQTLKGVSAGAWIQKSLPKLTNLRKLYIHGVSGSDANALSLSLKELDRLVSLGIGGEDALGIGGEDGIPSDNIIKAFSNQVCLTKLSLFGAFINKEQLPSVSEFPRNLMKIILGGSDLTQDPMPTLEKLPHLRHLDLSIDAYKGTQMTCSAKGFPQLLSLELHHLSELEEWKIEEEAMPSLKGLRLYGCSGLKMIPEGLRNVTTLDELNLINMPVELGTRIKENTGEDWYKIKHVPKMFWMKI